MRRIKESTKILFFVIIFALLGKESEWEREIEIERKLGVVKKWQGEEEKNRKRESLKTMRSVRHLNNCVRMHVVFPAQRTRPTRHKWKGLPLHKSLPTRNGVGLKGAVGTPSCLSSPCQKLFSLFLFVSLFFLYF